MNGQRVDIAPGVFDCIDIVLIHVIRANSNLLTLEQLQYLSTPQHALLGLNIEFASNGDI